MKTFLKSIIIRALAYFGYEFGRVKPRISSNPTDKAIDVLPLLVKDAAAKCIAERNRSDNPFAPFTFVQIGANDGVLYDQLHELMCYGWRGLLVEPNPEAFARLRETYRHYSDFVFAQKAVVGIDFPTGDVTLYACNADGEQSVKASLHKPIAALGLASKGLKAQAISVPGITLSALLGETGFENGVDFFITDTEGEDYEIMRQLVASDFRPTLLQFENFFMSQSQHEMICASLSSLGYSLLVVNYDTIALRKTK